MRIATRPAVSCVIITGYLGSGKTTLLNNILRQQYVALDVTQPPRLLNPPTCVCRSALRLAVLVNEVGAVDIDGQLVNIQQVVRPPGYALNMVMGVATRGVRGVTVLWSGGGFRTPL
jgi:signal recognition particle receptor subunit beta